MKNKKNVIPALKVIGVIVSLAVIVIFSFNIEELASLGFWGITLLVALFNGSIFGGAFLMESLVTGNEYDDIEEYDDATLTSATAAATTAAMISAL